MQPVYTPSSQQGVNNSNEKSQYTLQRPVFLIPVRQTKSNELVHIPITNSLKSFLLLSGFLYCLWGIIIFSIQLGIVVNSYSNYYYGFWTGVFLDIGGIVMMIYGLKLMAPVNRLIRMLIFIALPCLTGFIYTIVNYCMTSPCQSTTSTYLCDDSLFRNLKLSLLIVFSLAAVHTPMNIFYLTKEYNRALKQSYPTILNS